MSKKTTLYFVLGVVVGLAATTYAVTAPYERFPGVVIGGELTPPPADWNTVNDHGVVFLKLAGFPPFVIRIVYSTDDGGIITATRPDGGYWAGRVRGGTGGSVSATRPMRSPRPRSSATSESPISRTTARRTAWGTTSTARSSPASTSRSPRGKCSTGRPGSLPYWTPRQTAPAHTRAGTCAAEVSRKRNFQRARQGDPPPRSRAGALEPRRPGWDLWGRSFACAKLPTRPSRARYRASSASCRSMAR